MYSEHEDAPSMVRNFLNSLFRPRGRPMGALSVDVDFLVYSSHKTATQSIVATLNNSGSRARHLHILDNLGIDPGRGAFRRYLEEYRSANRRRLTVISTFRLPWDRHMSSFFQWHAQGVVREGLVSASENTVIARAGLPELQALFRSEIENGTLRGREDSLTELCTELGYEVAALGFDPSRRFEIFEDELIRLVLFRYDLLLGDFQRILEEAVGAKLTLRTDNLTEDKWYAAKFAEFRSTLVVKPDLIQGAHSSKRELIEAFYPHQYELIVERCLGRFGGCESIADADL